MYRKLLIVFASFVLCASKINAQDLKLINSVSQSWSGGIAGRYGTNYSFIIATSEKAKELRPDTIWIEETPYPLAQPDTGNAVGGMYRKIKTGKTIKYEINIQITHDEYEEGRGYRPNLPDTKTHIPKPPIHYKGVALVSYNLNGKEHYFTIGKIMHSMKPANYP